MSTRFIAIRSASRAAHVPARPKPLRHVSLVFLVLTLFLVGCTGDESADADAGGEQLGEEGVHGTGGAGAGQMLAVSVMDGGALVPVMPAGTTTLTIDNTGGQECVLSMEPVYGGSMSGQGATGPGTDGQAAATGPGTGAETDTAAGTGTGTGAGTGDAAGATSGTGGTATPGTADQGTAGQGTGTTQGLTQNRIAAGQATTVTVDLQPGTYEVQCIGEDGVGQPASPLLVMVTEAGTGMGTGATGTPGGGTGGTTPGTAGGATEPGGTDQ